MASGPMRAACGREELFRGIGYREQAPTPWSAGKQPLAARGGVRQDRRRLWVAPSDLTLLVARRRARPGPSKWCAVRRDVSPQAARSGFDLARVQSGYGVAPLPPVAANDLAGIGRTNDAVLYGGEVTLWVTATTTACSSWARVCPAARRPITVSPFAQVFERYNRGLLPHRPAAVSARRRSRWSTSRPAIAPFGRLCPDVLRPVVLG